jgi:predicted metalloprotease with PDZ domain
MQYFISIPNPLSHFISIRAEIDNISSSFITLKLPAWRPGRYELANFAKNVQKFSVKDASGKAIPFTKNNKDSWVIPTDGIQKLCVDYNYYAFQMDAGNSWVDEEQVYINFINCMLYMDDRLHQACEVQLELPEDYEIACGLAKPNKHTLLAKSYYHLVDSPMVASNKLQKLSYSYHNTNFFLWFMGDHRFDTDRILKDFAAFTQTQVDMMGGFPCDDYHFLYQILPYRHYHGVEHFNSTIITLGPSERTNSIDLYKDLLGVSAHELFHTWNIIRIRPKEMLPYDFSTENYFPTGFVAEGFTTYYGDLFLVRSGVFNKQDYFHEINIHLKRHFENFGRFNLSLAESSFDLWLDGYTPGVPGRKVSIYVKGALVALMLDLTIRKLSTNQKSLDTLLQKLWSDFGKKNTGYTIEDIEQEASNIAETSMESFFADYIFGNKPIEEELNALLETVGCRLHVFPPENPHEGYFGFKVSTKDNGSLSISTIAPNSKAAQLLSTDDELIAIDGIKLTNNLAELIYGKPKIEITLFRNHKLRTIQLENNGETYFHQVSISQLSQANDAQKESFKNWLGCHW